ncbi:hypothetical protein [Brevibacillus daliensis]|uniref:hypothetical protein n=1 Tax=Brevibacillus daliensis TaxID=2892995 RepID=UPI001E28A08D|nr:hypothetical protein [Brevibacillus daliensis]
MDKSKAIEAYRHGLISIKECSQIIGMETRFMETVNNLYEQEKNRVTKVKSV